MKPILLVLNLGSSSLKFAIYQWPSLTMVEQKTMDFDPDNESALDNALQQLFFSLQEKPLKITAVGHRLVHGGQKLTQAVVVTDDILRELHVLAVLAPLHLPVEIAAIEWIKKNQSNIAQIACFDTAFHATQSKIAQTFALPRAMTEEGIIRYGFHGLSYQYISIAMQDHLPVSHRDKVIVAHLGSGSSMCAMKNGQSVATTMGFSALDGLMMGTRCGDLDPGIIFYLCQQKGMSLDQVQQLLYRESGLLGVSGTSGDMRELELIDTNNAREAKMLFAYRAASHLGSLMMALEGLDAVIFTAGIGEHSATTRADIVRYLSWMGARIDIDANKNNETVIHAADSRIGIYVLPTDEEKMIAQQVKILLIDH